MNDRYWSSDQPSYSSPQGQQTRSPNSNRPRVPSISPQTSGISSEPSQPYLYSHRGSYDASPYFSPQQSTSYFGNQTQQPTPYASIPSQSSYSVSQAFYNEPLPYSPDSMARLRTRPPVNYNDDSHTANEFNERVPSQSRIPPPPQAVMQSQPISQQPDAPAPSSSEAVPQPTKRIKVDINTKFPVARIKRIMQTDEDIGKVAQAAPTAVAKALELFMVDLVAKGAANAKAQNSKRVTATHLKNALLADPQYDFLNEICESVPDESLKKSRGKSEAKSESDDDDIAAAAPKKKRGGKRKKGGDDSD